MTTTGGRLERGTAPSTRALRRLPRPAAFRPTAGGIAWCCWHGRRLLGPRVAVKRSPVSRLAVHDQRDRTSRGAGYTDASVVNNTTYHYVVWAATRSAPAGTPTRHRRRRMRRPTSVVSSMHNAPASRPRDDPSPSPSRRQNQGSGGRGTDDDRRLSVRQFPLRRHGSAPVRDRDWSPGDRAASVTSTANITLPTGPTAGSVLHRCRRRCRPGRDSRVTRRTTRSRRSLPVQDLIS